MPDLLLINGRLITPTGVVVGGWVRVSAGRVAALGRGELGGTGERIDLAGRFLSAGFVDLHLHAAGDVPFAEPADPGRRQIAGGMTGCLLTTSRGPLERMVEEMREEHRRLSGRASPRMAPPGVLSPPATIQTGGWRTPPAEPCGPKGLASTVLGVHLEGPFVNPEAPGAIPLARIEPPDAERMAKALDAFPWPVRLVTLAPELPGAEAVIALLRGRGIAVSMGHTLADFECARRAADQGVTATTHTFNAMGFFHHRAPGAIGAALTDDRLNAEVIADGVHVHPAAVRALVKARGVDGIRLGTDATLADRLAIPGYTSDGTIYRDQAGRIAGGLLTLDRAVRNLAQFAGLDLAEAVRAATVNPARLIGLAGCKGLLAPGADADLVAFDDEVNVSLVLIKGKRCQEPFAALRRCSGRA